MHRSLTALNKKINAKFRYCVLCKSVQTYFRLQYDCYKTSILIREHNVSQSACNSSLGFSTYQSQSITSRLIFHTAVFLVPYIFSWSCKTQYCWSLGPHFLPWGTPLLQSVETNFRHLTALCDVWWIKSCHCSAPQLELWPSWNVGPIRESRGDSGYRAPTNRKEQQNKNQERLESGIM